MEKVQGSDGSATAESVTVIGWGTAASPAARMLAKEREAQLALLDDGDAVKQTLGQTNGPVLVVTTTRDIDEFLDLVHGAADTPNRCLGFILGDDEAQCLRRAERLCEVSGPGARGDQPYWSVEPCRLHGASLATYDDAEEAARSIEEPSEVAFIVGHSNGFDMLAGHVFMCMNDEASEDEPSLALLPCFHGAECTRIGPNQLRLNPRRIRATRIISVACWGVNLSGALYDTPLSVSTGFLDNGNIEAMITTVRIACSHPAAVALLYYYANLGLPFGQVANRVNAELRGLGYEMDYACFGEPTSRLEPSVEEHPMRIEGRSITVQLEPRDEPRDIWLRVDPQVVPDEPLIVETSEACSTGVITPTGDLFLTVEPEGETVSITLASKTELRRDEAAAAVLRDIEALGRLLRSISPTDDETQELANEAHACWRQAIDYLERWPFGLLGVGELTHEFVLDDMWSGVEQRVSTLAVATAKLYSRYVDSHSCIFPFYGGLSRYEGSTLHTSQGQCVQCGNTNDQTRYRARLGDLERVVFACRVCGLTYSGDPSLVSELRGPKLLRERDQSVAHVTVTNPYDFPVKVCAVVVFAEFRRDKRPHADPIVVDLDANAEAQLEIPFEIPPETIPGRHNLGACVLVGARSHFMRAPLTIGAPLQRIRTRPPTETEAKA
ncbi:MAG: hypothetical protein AAF799_01165 [Myxococcota bacterium]